MHKHLKNNAKSLRQSSDSEIGWNSNKTNVTLSCSSHWDSPMVTLYNPCENGGWPFFQFLENQPRNLTLALKNHPKLSRKPPTNSQVAGRHWPKLAEPASCTREGLSQTSCWHTKSHEPSPKTRGWSCNRSLVIGHGLLENPIGVSVATFDDTWGYMFIQLPYKYLQTLALLLTNHGETMCATL